ncbi:MAG TPA: hypothetical protein VGI43_13700 [Mucilaginibacter sp.]|jgi:hypothetical protein
MRTSNKLITAIFLLILLSLFGYDYLLKTAYLTGSYKDPYGDFESLKFKDFDTVDVISSTVANVKFIQGPFSVKIDRVARDYIKIKQQGKRLQIDVNFASSFFGNPNPYVLLISCPNLNEVNTSAIYQIGTRRVTDTVAREDWHMRQVLIDGFHQDSLNITQDFGSTIVFNNNSIGSVNALVGKSPGSGSEIIVQKTNRFQKTNFDIHNKSKLLLNDAAIQSLNYHLADSAKLIMTGAAINKEMIIKSNQK